jgi:alanine-alpha-ketoisovalerate/valine-pyruvate aminotransferase
MLPVTVLVKQQTAVTEGTVSAFIYLTLSFTNQQTRDVLNHTFFPLPTEFCASGRFNLEGNSTKH